MQEKNICIDIKCEHCKGEGRVLVDDEWDKYWEHFGELPPPSNQLYKGGRVWEECVICRGERTVEIKVGIKYEIRIKED